MVQAVTLQDVYVAFDTFEATEGCEPDRVQDSYENLYTTLSGYLVHQGMVSAEYQASVQSIADRVVRMLEMTPKISPFPNSAPQSVERHEAAINHTKRRAAMPQAIEGSFFRRIAIKSDKTLEEQLAEVSREDTDPHDKVNRSILQQAIKADTVFSALKIVMKERSDTEVNAKLEEYLAIQEKVLPDISHEQYECMISLLECGIAIRDALYR